MIAKYWNKIITIFIVSLIGFLIFLFGSPRIEEFLNRKNDTINTITLKLQIIESIQTADQPAMKESANTTMSKFTNMKQQLCRRQYFYLKSDCELPQLNNINLLKLNTLLEAGIQEIVTMQDNGQQ